MKYLMRNTLIATASLLAVSAVSAQTTIANFTDLHRYQNNNGNWAFRDDDSRAIIGNGSGGGIIMMVATTFNISDLGEAINSAPQINLSFDYVLHNGGQLEIELFAFTKTSGTLVSGDYATPATSMGTVFAPGGGQTGTLSFDVTSFVKNATEDYVAFRIVAPDYLEWVSTRNNNHNIQLPTFSDPAFSTSARLEVIPEPGTVALLAGCASLGVVLLRRRVRKS